MPWLDRKDGGGRVYVPDDQVEEAVASDLYEVGGKVVVKDDRSGISYQTDTGEALSAMAQDSIRGETGGERFERQEDARKEREHGGVGGALRAGIEGGADAITLGGYGWAADRLLGEDFAQDRRETAEVNSGWRTLGEVGATLATAGLATVPGKAGQLARMTPLGRLSAATEAAAARGGMLAKAVAYGKEGAIVGAGEGLSQATLSEDPLTLERAVASMGAGALYGGALGGGMSLAGSALSKGLRRGSRMLKESSEKAATVSDDLASLDRKGLRAKRIATKKALGEDVVEAVKAHNADQAAFRTALSGADSGGSKKVLSDSRGWIGKRLDDPTGLAENPNSIASSLRKEEKVMMDTLADVDGRLARLKAADDGIADKLDELISGYEKEVKLEGPEAALFGDLSGKRIKGKGKSKGALLDKGDLEEFRDLIRKGEADRMRREAMEALPQSLERNRALQRKIAAIKDETAPELEAITDAFDAFSGGKREGIVEGAIKGTVFGMAAGALSPLGIVGTLAAGKVAGKVGDIVAGRVGKVATDASIRSAKAIDAFLDTAIKLKPAAIPTATKVLLGTQFTQRDERQEQPKTLPEAFKARAEEIRSLTQVTPRGPKLRPDKRREIAANLEAVRAVSPIAADRMETTAARQIEFLASKLPRRPDLAVMRMGPDRWQPSSLAMRAFARYVEAVNNPGAIEERLATGTVTPEDAEAMRTVYPEMYEDIKARILARLPELKESLPYERRLALSIFSGVPVDEAMHPAILAQLQGQFADEPGTQGGTVAPRAQPQFGSVSREQPTPAQQRAQG